jgi:hypothetical protein
MLDSNHVSYTESSSMPQCVHAIHYIAVDFEVGLLGENSGSHGYEYTDDSLLGYYPCIVVEVDRILEVLTLCIIMPNGFNNILEALLFQSQLMLPCYENNHYY